MWGLHYYPPTKKGEKGLNEASVKAESDAYMGLEKKSSLQKKKR